MVTRFSLAAQLIVLFAASTCAASMCAAAAPLRSSSLHDDKAPQSVKELWSDFDPRQEALDVKTVREWQKHGVTYCYVTFHIGQFKGKDARMAGFYAFPTSGTKLPNNRWYFGCQGNPKLMLVTDDKFNLQGRHELDCSLGIVGLPNGQLLSASGRSDARKGCTGKARIAIPDDSKGCDSLSDGPLVGFPDCRFFERKK